MSKKKSSPVGTIAAAATVAGSLATGDPLGAVGGALEVVQQVRRFYAERQIRIVEALLSESYDQVSSDQGAYADFKGLFEAGDLRSNDAKATFLWTVRVAESAVDDAVFPALAMLMREYMQAGKKIDAFFRGWSRVLQELTVAEYDSLRAILVAIEGVDKYLANSVTRAVEVHTVFWETIADARSGKFIPGEAVLSGRAIPRLKIAGCTGVDARRVTHLMDVNGLGKEMLGKKGAPFLEIEYRVAQRLRKLVPR